MWLEHYISSLILASGGGKEEEREREERKRRGDYFFVKLSHYSRLQGGIHSLASYSGTCYGDWVENIILKVNWELTSEGCTFNMEVCGKYRSLFVSISVGFTSISLKGPSLWVFWVLCAPEQREWLGRGLSLDTAMMLEVICNLIAHIFSSRSASSPGLSQSKQWDLQFTPGLQNIGKTYGVFPPLFSGVYTLCSPRKKSLFSLGVDNTRETVFRALFPNHPWWLNSQRRKAHACFIMF